MNSVFDPELQIQSIEAKIVAALERLSQVFRVLLWDENKKHGLSPLQIQILIYLLFHEEQIPGVKLLSEEFNVAKPTASDAVQTLIKKDLLTESQDSNDGRRKVLKLTESGHDKALKVSLFANRIQEEIRNFSSREKSEMLELLLRLIYGLQLEEVISIDRMCFHCLYFLKSNDPQQPHFCRLLNTPLSKADLRIDCPEFIQIQI